MGKMSLIIVVGFNIIFMLMGFNLAGIASHSYKNYTNYYTLEQASFLAESAANIAVGSLYQNNTWLLNDTSTHTHNLEGGTYSFKAVRTNPNGLQYVTFYICSQFGDLKDSTIVVCNVPQFSSFAMYTCYDNNIYWNSGETCNGKLHADSVLYISGSPTFNGAVSVGNSVSLQSGATPNYKQGAPTVGQKLGWVNDFSSVTGVAGYTSLDSTYKPASSKLKADVYIRMNPDGTIQIDTGSYVGDGLGYRKAKNVYKGTITGSSSIGVFAVTDTSSNVNIHLRGQLNGKMTIANLGHGNIYIDSSATYKDTSSTTTNLLGLVARDTIYVTDDTVNCQSAVTIDAAILATTFTAQHIYNNTPNTSQRLFSNQQTLNVMGSLAQYSRGIVGATNSSNGKSYGFQKNYTYDTRFAASVGAQGYPTLAYFSVYSWYESLKWSSDWWQVW